MAGATKLMTSGAGGVIVTPTGTLSSDITVNVPTAGVNGGTLVCSDSSGNVGIGTSSPARKLHVVGPTGGTAAKIESGGSQTYLQFTCNSQSNGDSGYIGYDSNKNLILYTTDIERMRIDSSGNLLVGTTSLGPYSARFALSSNSGTTKWDCGPYATPTNFIISGQSGGGVYLNGTASNSWASTSDERLKENLEPIQDAISKVNSLRAVTGNYTFDEEKQRRAFLIAQDVQAVLPEAVSISPDGEHLGMSYADTIPLLVAAIKELSAKNDALEARIAVLEAK